MDLDLAVARAVYAARQVERALHSQGAFWMEWGGQDVPATRVITESRVIFLAHFDAVCHLVAPEPVLTLHVGADVLGVREIADPGDSAFSVEWVFEVAAPARV